MEAQVRKSRMLHRMGQLLLASLCACSAVFAHAQGNVATFPATAKGSFEFSYVMFYAPATLPWYPTLQAACEANAVYLSGLRDTWAGAYCLETHVDPGNVSGYWFATIVFPNWPQPVAVNWITESPYTRAVCPTGYGNGTGTWDETATPRSLVVTCSRANACPANATGMPVNYPATCICNDGYAPDSTATSCVPMTQCEPPNAINPTNGQCEPTCKSPDVVDPATGQCVHCTVNPLPQPPFKGDTNPACTASLEKGKGKDVDHKCPSLNPKMTEPNGGQIQCLADKINKLALTPAYTGPSATIRTEAYQEHLRAVWDKSEEIKNKKLTDAEKQACAAVIADVAREKNDHGIDFSPSKKKSEAPHVKGNALDIPRDVAKALKAKLTDTTVIAPVNCFLGICMSIPVHIGDVQDYVNSETLNPPACDLLWGGRFGDKVHFQLQHP